MYCHSDAIMLPENEGVETGRGAGGGAEVGASPYVARYTSRC
jgi:hypothetical protein